MCSHLEMASNAQWEKKTPSHFSFIMFHPHGFSSEFSMFLLVFSHGFSPGEFFGEIQGPGRELHIRVAEHGDAQVVQLHEMFRQHVTTQLVDDGWMDGWIDGLYS